MQVRNALKTMICVGAVAGSSGLLIGAKHPDSAQASAGARATPMVSNAPTLRLAHNAKITRSQCSTPSGMVVFPDCEVWVTMSTNDSTAVDFYVNNDTPNPSFMALTGNCSASLFSGCYASPNSYYLIANGGGVHFQFVLTTLGSTGTEDIPVRFDATNIPEYVSGLIHVTIQ